MRRSKKDPRHDQSAQELKDQIALEGQGEAFVIYRDESGRQHLVALPPTGGVVGRSKEAEVPLSFDDEVSRTHARIERIGDRWFLVDDGLSRNGSFVNGARASVRERLADGDALRFGETVVVFREPGATLERPAETVVAAERSEPPPLTEAQRQVLIALCRPFARESAFAKPATNREIAAELFISVATVKTHLRALFGAFELQDLPQNAKRLRLAELALESGAVSLRDYRE